MNSRTKLFLDTEFTELRQSASLISLALVAENGLSFYAEFTDYDSAHLSDWHRQYVLPNLFLTSINPVNMPETQTICGTSASIRVALMNWLQNFGQVEIWADVLAYDWVLFCEIFGGAFSLPANVLYIPFDLGTLFYLAGDPDVTREEFAFPDASSRCATEAAWSHTTTIPKHNALWDAQVSRVCYWRLREVFPQLTR